MRVLRHSLETLTFEVEFSNVRPMIFNAQMVIFGMLKIGSGLDFN